VEYISAGDCVEKTETGTLVSDAVVIDAVFKRLAALSSSAGYVLDGFPRTKVQAVALQRFLPEKLILLNASETSIKQRCAEKGIGDSDNIHRQLQHHYRHVSGIAEVFKNILGQLDVRSEDSSAIYTQMKKLIHLRALSNAPKRPPRICIVGPPGIGKTTQARITASDLGCVRIDVHALLNERGCSSDEEICALVGERLQQIDCIRCGWVLDGFPNTSQQSKFLKKTYKPTRVIQLAGSDAVCLKRLSARRIDPVTGESYYENPDDPAILKRLVQAEMDLPERVMERYEKYSRTITEITKDYATAKEVRGDLERDKVAEIIDKFVRGRLEAE